MAAILEVFAIIIASKAIDRRTLIISQIMRFGVIYVGNTILIYLKGLKHFKYLRTQNVPVATDNWDFHVKLLLKS